MILPSFPLSCPIRFSLAFLATAAFELRGQATVEQSAAEDDTVVLSPFEVSEDANEGYLATSTLAGTRLSTDLKEVGAAVSVYTPQFLDDTAANKLEDILTFTASTEGGGINGNYSGGVASESGDLVRSNPSGTLRVRSLAEATRTRDYFASDVPSDMYNIDTVTISRGPNAILAGIGAPGGIVDSALKKAMFKDAYSVSFELGKHGSTRSELHLNQTLIDQRLAVRIDALYDDREYRQSPAAETDRRIYSALNWVVREPSESSAFLGRTSIRANIEDGEIVGVPPDTLTPVMSTSSWFPDDPTTANPYWRTNGALRRFYDQHGNQIPANPGDGQSPVGYTLPGYTLLDGFPIYRQWAIVFNDPTSSTPSVGFTDAGLSSLQGFQGGLAGGQTVGFFRGTGDWGRAPAGYSRTRLLDSNIFDFYNNLLTGSLDYREQNFTAYDVRLEQLLWNGKAGFEIAVNSQEFERFHNFPATGSPGGNNEVYIDTNEFLSIRSEEYPMGIPNPNFGRPMIKSFTLFRDVTRTTENDAFQVTAFLEHDFSDQTDGGLGELLGRHTLTALYFDTERLRTDRDVTGGYGNQGQLQPGGSLASNIGSFNAQATAIWYIGDSQLGNNYSDMRLQPITSGRLAQDQTYTLRIYDPASNTFQTGTATPVKYYSTYRDQLEEIRSTALAMQSRWWKGNLVTLVGWRDDDSETFSSPDPVLRPDGTLDLSNYRLLPAATQTKESWTYSAVLRFPEEVLFDLPFDSDLRVSWNRSENFSPVGLRRNQYNEEVGSPTAETEEFGVILSMFSGKLDVRVNRYETKIAGAGIAGPVNAYSYISELIRRMLSARDLGLHPADYGYVSPQFNTFEDVAQAFFEILPERMKANIGPEHNFNPRFEETPGGLAWRSDNITNYASLSSLVARGWEYELVWNPNRNWRVAINASESEAVTDNLAALELEFGNEILANSQSMFGGALVGGNRNPGQAAADANWEQQYFNEHISLNLAQAALSGSPTPEISKWRFNLLTNYTFTEGPLDGFSVGGALRWVDKSAVGFPRTIVDGQSISDVNNPYYGPTDTRVDLNVSYSRPLRMFGRDTDWSVRLDVSNAFGSDGLLPITRNPDGSLGTVRISAEPRVWSIRNNFSF